MFQRAQQKMMDATLAMQAEATSRVAQEQYKAAVEVYLKQIQMNQELAHQFLQNHQEEQKQIFDQAMTIIDIGIDGKNPELVRYALILTKPCGKMNRNFSINIIRLDLGDCYESKKLY